MKSGTMETMIRVEQLQAEIKTLPPADFRRLWRWIVDTDWEQWDRQLESDSETGKLDLLIEEAMVAKAQSLLSEYRV